MTNTASEGITDSAHRESARRADAAAVSGRIKEKAIIQAASKTKTQTEKLCLCCFIANTSRIKIEERKEMSASAARIQRQYSRFFSRQIPRSFLEYMQENLPIWMESRRFIQVEAAYENQKDKTGPAAEGAGHPA